MKQLIGSVTRVIAFVRRIKGSTIQITTSEIQLIASSAQITICTMQTTTSVTPITKFMMVVHIYAVSTDIWTIYYGNLQYHISFYHTKPSLFVKESNK